MHVFFSGIGGTGIGPLALIAKQAGYDVSGSDKQNSSYVDSLRAQGITDITIGQSTEAIAGTHQKKPIDWLVYSSAVPKENPDHPELLFAEEHDITSTKRDEFLNQLLEETGQEMIAIAGTHGKTTTTAMTIWLFKQLGIPISYSVGAKLPFGAMGEFNPDAEYFIYEADEYDRNFLSFKPAISIIPGIAYDHPDVYPTQEEYNAAFLQFFDQSESVYMWYDDAEPMHVESTEDLLVMHKEDYESVASQLVGRVNRENAALIVQAVFSIDESRSFAELSEILNQFPGVSRRFEKICEHVYSDYAHTPEKIAGAIQIARETSENIVVVYEGLHNTRQHFIKKELETLFTGVKKLYIVPSYLAREDETLEMLTPEKLSDITQKPTNAEAAELNEGLKKSIASHVQSGDLVLCLSAGGGGSLDEWLRKEFA